MSCFTKMKMLVAGLALCLAPATSSALLVTYTSTNGSGLKAEADFTLIDSTHISVLLKNTSPANNTQNGSANMVLSSLNFDMGGVEIIGGSAVMGAGSDYVRSTNTSAWSVIATPANFNNIWGYTNDGLGQPVPDGDNAVSPRGTGGGITLFNGGTQNGGSLDNGIVPIGSDDIGNNRNFIRNSILIFLTLDTAISDLSFLSNGSFVEFGSDYLFIPNDPTGPQEPQEPVIPEPATLVLLGIGLAGMNAVRRFKKS